MTLSSLQSVGLIRVSEEQLASDAESILASLDRMETKCFHASQAQIEIAEQDPSSSFSKVARADWEALFTLHRILLDKYYDFFLASQCSSASPVLQRLAVKYAMPVRMWEHGIHSFLSQLRRQLPSSIEYMLAFIYLAYHKIALLYETVPLFEENWTEYLGSLGRYRMEIEYEAIQDREIWADVARSWYSRAADVNPSVGRPFHHLANLTRPNSIQRLYYHARSLVCVQPFLSSRKAIPILLDTILSRTAASYSYTLLIDSDFIQAHGILCQKLPYEEFEVARLNFQGQLDNHIDRVAAKWKVQGVYIAVTNITGWFDYGIHDAVLRQIFLLYNYQRAQSKIASSKSDEQEQVPSAPSQPRLEATLLSITDTDIPSKLETLSRDSSFSCASFLTMSTFSLVLRRIGDRNVLPHVHVLLVFLYSLANIPYTAHLINHAPWNELVYFLNSLLEFEPNTNKLLSGLMFPLNQVDDIPLPEDHLMRGQIWCQCYFPNSWFARDQDQEDRYIEFPSTVQSRTKRVLRLGHRLSAFNRWISYDTHLCIFSVLSPSNLRSDSESISSYDLVLEVDPPVE